jgi:dipeptidyl aminopeptidase/acylaminoacyl peptidase
MKLLILLLLSVAAAESPVAPMPFETGNEPPAVAPEPDVRVVDDGTVRIEGAPDIPDSLRERLNQYLNVRWASFRDFDATGQRLLTTTRLGEVGQVHEVSIPMGSRHQLTFAGEPARDPQYAPGTQDVVYTTDFGGNEQAQIVRLDRATGKTVLLTDGTSKHGAPVFSADGDRIAFSSTARNGTDMDCWIGDAKDPANNRLAAELQGYWGPGDWAPDGQRIVLWKYNSSTDSELHLLDVDSGTVTRLTPEAPTASYSNAMFDGTPGGLFVTSDRDGEFTQLYHLDLGTMEWTPLSADIPWNVTALALSSDGKTLAFIVNEDGYATVQLVETKTGKRKTLPLPRGIVYSMRFARDADVLGFSLVTPARTGNAYTWDLKKKTLTQWTDSELGGLNAETFIEPELIRYPTFDGKTIPAFYYRPPGDGPFPTVIDIHGGPEGQARPYFSATNQFLVNESKVAIVIPNVRGSRGYGKSWLKLDNGPFLREESVQDIGALLDWIAERPELDADRVAVQGGSYGGYMVLAALVHYSDRIRAGVDVVGISNFVTFLENTKPYRQAVRRVEYGDERDPEQRAKLEAISPLNHIDKIDAALFVGHGANDPRVPVGEAEQVVAAVRESGREAWYMLARNEGHGFGKKRNRDLFTLLRALFYDEYLVGE